MAAVSWWRGTRFGGALLSCEQSVGTPPPPSLLVQFPDMLSVLQGSECAICLGNVTNVTVTNVTVPLAGLTVTSVSSVTRAARSVVSCAYDCNVAVWFGSRWGWEMMMGVSCVLLMSLLVDETASVRPKWRKTMSAIPPYITYHIEHRCNNDVTAPRGKPPTAKTRQRALRERQQHQHQLGMIVINNASFGSERKRGK